MPPLPRTVGAPGERAAPRLRFPLVGDEGPAAGDTPGAGRWTPADIIAWQQQRKSAAPSPPRHREDTSRGPSRTLPRGLQPYAQDQDRRPTAAQPPGANRPPIRACSPPDERCERTQVAPHTASSSSPTTSAGREIPASRRTRTAGARSSLLLPGLCGSVGGASPSTAFIRQLHPLHPMQGGSRLRTAEPSEEGPDHMRPGPDGGTGPGSDRDGRGSRCYRAPSTRLCHQLLLPPASAQRAPRAAALGGGTPPPLTPPAPRPKRNGRSNRGRRGPPLPAGKRTLWSSVWPWSVPWAGGRRSGGRGETGRIWKHQARLLAATPRRDRGVPPPPPR